MKNHDKSFLLKKQKEKLLEYSLGSEYPKLFEYENGVIKVEKVWLTTIEGKNKMVIADNESGFPLCKEDIAHLIKYLEDLSKRAPTREEMKQIEISNLKEEIERLECSVSSEKCSKKRDKSYIYFARFVGKDLFKVGFSSNPEARVKQLQLLTTDILSLEAIIPISNGISPLFFEKKVHQYLENKGLRKRGELFCISDSQLLETLSKFEGGVI